MTHRFFLPLTSFNGDLIRFGKEVTHQIRDVLRLDVGQPVIALDNFGHEFWVTLLQVDVEGVVGRIDDTRVANGEPAYWLALFLGLTQREKFEWMLQKCTEVGASSFIPVVTERSLVQDEGSVIKKHERWNRILREAAEQSGRGRIPELQSPLHFQKAMREACKENDTVLFLWEGEHGRNMRQALNKLTQPGAKTQRLACFIGPEGGFSSSEVDLAVKSGALPVTLGPRILRMETAAVVATALLLAELER